ncbi:hypothetical protein B5K08_12780 [Rhizobium leguminosarum bv. trifolii]|uniref:Uncharacterized protein n=1 Tax=Rhizobium leguminosarum bv. trifolii TaxID=386 RepID=A0A3E1BL47_RHILT|nr:hypothetical protein B5K08_12780 [Rhizobium leguminosarum bv. trifolii]RFB94076.1 hypothetical protein B5K10_12770 [Rhizobium leguminosarum bv. trifolii]
MSGKAANALSESEGQEKQAPGQWPTPSFEAPAGHLRMRAERGRCFWFTGERSGKPDPTLRGTQGGLQPLAARSIKPNGTTISPHPEVCRPQAGTSKDEGGWLDLQHADPTLAEPTSG